ncbi:MAG: Z1 domain-containing protein, partial [Lachnospiraceae bacterium]
KIYEEEQHKVTVEDLKNANPKYGFLDEVEEKFLEFDILKQEIQVMLKSVYNIMLGEEKEPEYVKDGIHLCVDNCQANKEAEEGTTLRIVYPSNEQLQEMEKDPVFIVIGGNTLSRGLTIDGLVCTYFSRNSNQADTLMQMARWFGYRKGYELLQRIWMTSLLQRKFEALAKIDMDMKEEIERFMERGISPEQFGPRIRNIPEIKSFRITSKKKSQQAEYDDFDFRGDSYETTDFDDEQYLEENIKVTERFLSRISENNILRRSDTVKAYVWNSVEYDLIRKEFFDKYYISKNSALEINLPILCRWIEKMQEEGKYLHWDVAVADGDDKEVMWAIDDSVKVGKIVRTRKVSKEEYIDIGSLRSGKDALADVCIESLSVEQKEILEKVLKSGKDIVSKRSMLNLDDVPLLLIYRIKKNGGETKGVRRQMDTNEDIIGISIIISGDGIGGNHANSIRIKMSEREENE